MFQRYRTWPPAVLLDVAEPYTDPLTSTTARPLPDEPEDTWQRTARNGVL